MDKATKAIRRSGTKLRGLSSRHGNLQVLIGQLGDVRTSCKTFIGTQLTASDDLIRWTNDCENRAIQDACAYLSELSLLWTEVQKEFSERLREYRTQFELILEGERHVDQSRELYCMREQREIKCRKELDKSGLRGSEEMKLMEERVKQAEKGKDLAYLEVVDRIKENETVKLIRFREGLRKLSAAYVTLAEKCHMVFSAYHAVASTLPDVHEKDLQQVRYTGSREAAAYVQRAKEQVLCHRSRFSSDQPLPGEADPTLKQPQFVALPSQYVQPDLPPTSNGTQISKHEEANPKNCPTSLTYFSPTVNPISNARHDPPPSYSSIVNEDANTREGACGYTPSRVCGTEVISSSCNTSESAGPIQISYPAYLNNNAHADASVAARRVNPASAPVNNKDALDCVNANVEMRYDRHGISRSISNRRSGTEGDSSMHRVVRHEDSRLDHHCSDYNHYADVMYNETQKVALRGSKQSKKKSFKSLSFAGNAISGLLGLNGNISNTPRYRSARSLDYNNASRNFTNSFPSDRTDGDFHGVLPEEIDRHTRQLSQSSSSSSNCTGSKCNAKSEVVNEKSRALSAKFGIAIPAASEYREGLTPPCFVPPDTTDGDASSNVTAVSGRAESSKRRNGLDRVPKKDNTEVIVDAEVEQSESHSDINNLNSCVENKASAPEKIVSRGKANIDITPDLIDLDVSNEDNSNATLQSNLSKNLTEKLQKSASQMPVNIIPAEVKIAIKNGTEIISNSGNSSQNSSAATSWSNGSDGFEAPPLDGELSVLARPRRSELMSTNPFYEDCIATTDDSESDASNSVSCNR